jgi:glycosyltransferase involved in cell wall biosynthesis
VANILGIVAIGRNEGDRLRQCLVAARAVAPEAPIVYVDSGSTDGSADLARSFDAQVVDLDLSIPFTAARARNEGLARLLEVAPQTEFVQFIDGDCALQPGWLDVASAFLQSNTKTAAACGRRRERFPNASIYNKLADMEWDTPVGTVKACGGDVLMRIAALQQVGGYNNDVIAGEEPELCVRLRAAGWTIHRLDHEMTLHDAAMTRFGQWWKRNVRAGHAYAEGNARHGAPPERFRAKEVRSNWTWGLLAPIGTLLATIAIAVVLPRWSFIPPLLVLAGYAMLMVRIARYRRSRGDTPADARRYAFFTVIGKLPQALGQLKYHRNHRAGRRSTIIEYKSA